MFCQDESASFIIRPKPSARQYNPFGVLFINHKAGRLFITTECQACFDWLFPVLEQFRHAWPDVEVDIRTSLSAEALPALMREDVATEMAAEGEFFIWPHVSQSNQLVFVYRASEESSPSTLGMISVLKRSWE